MGFQILPLLVFPIVLGIVALIGFYNYHATQKRNENMRKVAGELGLAYQPVRPGQYDGRLAKYRLLTYGRARTSSNFIVAGTDELNLILFDHRYTTGSGKNKRTRKQTVAWIISQNLVMPEFSLAPETWLGKIADLFTKQDIDIQEDPEFSGRFKITGPNADAVREFFNVTRRDALLKLNPPTIECFPGELMFYRPRHEIAPDQLKTLMDEAFQLYQAFATLPA